MISQRIKILGLLSFIPLAIVVLNQWATYRQREIRLRQVDSPTPPDQYGVLLEPPPFLPFKKKVRIDDESILFQEARLNDTRTAYHAFLKRYPGSQYDREIRQRIEKLHLSDAINGASIEDCRKFLKNYPDSNQRQAVEDRIRWLQLDRQPDRKTYERSLTSTHNATGHYQQNPLFESAVDVSQTSPFTYKKIRMAIDEYYEKNKPKGQIPNAVLERFVRFVLTYDLFSRLRFGRGVDHFHGQKQIPELVGFIMQNRWYQDFLVRKTDDPTYGFMENHALQIVIGMHTAAHVFQLPYPTLFCLLFQESRFDFKISSPTGAVGLGQLTTVGLRQIAHLRTKMGYEKRLQTATTHLGNVYRDPFLLRYLEELGFKPKFPESVSVPRRVVSGAPRLVTKEILDEISNELLAMGNTVGAERKQLRNLLGKLQRGKMLPVRFAAVHQVFKHTVERRFGRDPESLLNPITNIFSTAILLRYYMGYRWKAAGKTLPMKPVIRSLAAIAAYNEGQEGVKRFFGRLRTDFPHINLRHASIKELEPIFTQQRVQANHPDDPGKAGEIFRHVTKIRDCSCL